MEISPTANQPVSKDTKLNQKNEAVTKEQNQAPATNTDTVNLSDEAVAAAAKGDAVATPFHGGGVYVPPDKK